MLALVTFRRDFGDSWSHTVLLSERSDRPMRGHRRLLDGNRSSPPEDCGGVSGYARLMSLLQHPAHHPELVEQLEWLGSWRPDAFDLNSARDTFDM